MFIIKQTIYHIYYKIFYKEIQDPCEVRIIIDNPVALEFTFGLVFITNFEDSSMI